jgi:hypothetical protein
MDINVVIENLRSQAPSRYRDAEIAQALGWTRDFETVSDESGKTKQKSFWRDPKGEPAKIPLYTSNLTSASELAEIVAPGAVIGFSWEPDMASARIGDGPYIQAATPAVALCIAALIRMHGLSYLPR